jgi:hypothetical protein
LIAFGFLMALPYFMALILWDRGRRSGVRGMIKAALIAAILPMVWAIWMDATTGSLADRQAVFLFFAFVYVLLPLCVVLIAVYLTLRLTGRLAVARRV